jgi:cytochrome c peroxidase
MEVLKSLWIRELPPAPASPSNSHADDPIAAQLGRSLFFDVRMSANNKVSCATCHDPSLGFTDAAPTARGIGVGHRRTMPIAQAVFSSWLFWDGRADSLWSQALGPIENPLEHGSTRMQVALVIATYYRPAYERVFGPLPDLSDTRRFPPRASPVTYELSRRAWAGIAPSDRTVVDRIFANFGKSIEAFERTIKVSSTRFDGYVAGVLGITAPGPLLSASEIVGARLFIGKGRCVTCHSGPMLSNHGFANTGVPPRPGRPTDTGRIDGARAAVADPFNCKGAFSDDDGRKCDELEFVPLDDPSQLRAYKVPSLRGSGQRPPYMHAGQFASLNDVIDHYDRAPRAVRGASELRPLHLSLRERRDLVAFLLTLNDPSSAAASNFDGGSRGR